MIFTRPVEIKRAIGWGRFVEQVRLRLLGIGEPRLGGAVEAIGVE